MVESFKKMWINGLNFKDRTSRSDYWNAWLMTVIVSFVLGIITGFMGETIAYYAGLIFSLVLIVPTLAMDVRRLHDVNKSGWYLLMELIPFVGWIFLLVAYCSKTVEPNKYGKQV